MPVPRPLVAIDLASGSVSEICPSSDAFTAKRFRSTVGHLVGQMTGSVHSTYFKEPVRPGEAANYFEIVKRPMDLKTLLQHVKAGKVSNSVERTAASMPSPVSVTRT